LTNILDSPMSPNSISDTHSFRMNSSKTWSRRCPNTAAQTCKKTVIWKSTTTSHSCKSTWAAQNPTPMASKSVSADEKMQTQDRDLHTNTHISCKEDDHTHKCITSERSFLKGESFFERDIDLHSGRLWFESA